MFTLLDLVLVPLHHLLVLLHPAVPPAAVVMLFTVVVRLLLHPLNRAAYRAGLHRRRIAPQLDALRARHRNDRQRLQREMLELHRAEGVPLAPGCLPMLVQLPVLALVYRLFSAPQLAGHSNVLLSHTLGGIPLSAHLTTVAAGQLWVFGVLVLSALGVAVLAARQARRHLALDAVPAVGESAQEVTAAAGQRVVAWLPYGTVVAVLLLPLAAGLYLVTTAMWTFVERAAVRRINLA